MDQLIPNKNAAAKELDLNLLFDQTSKQENQAAVEQTRRRVPEPVLGRPEFVKKYSTETSMLGRVHAQGVSEKPYQDQIEQLLTNSEGISGKTLQQIRELSLQSIDSIYKTIRISPNFLHAVEENNYALLPEMVYVKGFLRSLLKYLNVHQSEFIIQEIAKNIEHWKISQKKN